MPKFTPVPDGADRRAAFDATRPCLWTVLPEMRCAPAALRAGQLAAASLAMIAAVEARKAAIRKGKPQTAKAHEFLARKALQAKITLMGRKA